MIFYLFFATIVGFTLAIPFYRKMGGSRLGSRNFWETPGDFWEPQSDLRPEHNLRLKGGGLVEDSDIPDAIKECISKRSLAVVEFDDSGDYLSKFQRDYAGTIVNEGRETKTVYIYVHGWNHSGDPSRETGDLAKFAAYVRGLNRNKTGSNHKNIGVYIGWPGDAREGKLGNILSFPGRRAATDRIASPSLADCLGYIRRFAVKGHKKVVLIGHSMGGRIVERLATPVVQNYYHFRRLNPDPALENPRNMLLADTTILINAASEGLQARKLKLATHQWPYFEPPGLISVTSESDDSTDITWYWGKYLEEKLLPTVSSQLRQYSLGGELGMESVRHYISCTAGHDKRLLIGRIRPDETILDGIHIDTENLGGFPVNRGLFRPRRTEEAGEHRVASGGYLVFRAAHQILDGHNGRGTDKERGEKLDLEKSIFNSSMASLIEFFSADTDTHGGKTGNQFSAIRRKHDLDADYDYIRDRWSEYKK
ncbi:MAG: alpha/beta hydrolase [Verrucomicrobiales bacterium]|nr:alpha/beta hydrolase [Verrucomicrobiales bacterium]